MTDPVNAQIAPPSEPHPESATSEAQAILRRGSGGRRLARIALGLALLAGAGYGGWAGWRALLKQRARDTPMKHFPEAKATIGNDMWAEESPAHTVKLDAFQIDVTEVTVKAYRACVEDGACGVPIKGAQCNFEQKDRDDHPINCVTHDQAQRFCKWAGKRLPTEKEWEHAARSAFDEKQGDLFPWGPDKPSAKLVNACGKECATYFAQRGKGLPFMYEMDDGYPTTAPVARFPDGKTPEGLWDMAGNVWEWTASPYCAYPTEECGNELEYVIRGGGFQTYQPRTLEATSREALERNEATETVGFRCARAGR